MAARNLNKLTDTAVKAATEPGRHSDGGGLYLLVSPVGKRSWVYMWTLAGKRREMGLGPYPSVSLAKARRSASSAREMVADGIDPIEARRKSVEPTFAECAAEYIANIRAEWRNAKHEYQWSQTLGETYCKAIRSKRVSQITVDDVRSVLNPIWTEKAETASRLRGRIERVLDYAKAKGWRDGENPAVWRGNLRMHLPKRKKLQRGHQPAMPYADVAAFVLKLQAMEGMSARALEFTILTAVRSGETIGMKWVELNLDRLVWTIPGDRTKTGEAHSVPLSSRAFQILTELAQQKRGEFVFWGEPRAGNKLDAKTGRPLSNMAMMMLVRRMKVGDVSVHGFRSSFRDWAGEETEFPREVAEAALGHKVGNEVERAYRRGSALEKRRTLMQAWCDFCERRMPSGTMAQSSG